MLKLLVVSLVSLLLLVPTLALSPRAGWTLVPKCKEASHILVSPVVGHPVLQSIDKWRVEREDNFACRNYTGPQTVYSFQKRDVSGVWIDNGLHLLLDASQAFVAYVTAHPGENLEVSSTVGGKFQLWRAFDGSAAGSLSAQIQDQW